MRKALLNMLFGKERARLMARISELESLLCPDVHEFKLVCCDELSKGIVRKTYRCARCNKTLTKVVIFREDMSDEQV